MLCRLYSTLEKHFKDKTKEVYNLLLKLYLDQKLSIRDLKELGKENLVKEIIDTLEKLNIIKLLRSRKNLTELNDRIIPTEDFIHTLDEAKKCTKKPSIKKSYLISGGIFSCKALKNLCEKNIETKKGAFPIKYIDWESFNQYKTSKNDFIPSPFLPRFLAFLKRILLNIGKGEYFFKDKNHFTEKTKQNINEILNSLGLSHIKILFKIFRLCIYDFLLLFLKEYISFHKTKRIILNTNGYKLLLLDYRAFKEKYLIEIEMLLQKINPQETPLFKKLKPLTIEETLDTNFFIPENEPIDALYFRGFLIRQYLDNIKSLPSKEAIQKVLINLLGDENLVLYSDQKDLFISKYKLNEKGNSLNMIPTSPNSFLLEKPNIKSKEKLYIISLLGELKEEPFWFNITLDKEILPYYNILGISDKDIEEVFKAPQTIRRIISQKKEVNFIYNGWGILKNFQEDLEGENAIFFQSLKGALDYTKKNNKAIIILDV